MKEVNNIFDDFVYYEQKCLCVFVIDTFCLKNDMAIDEVTLGIQRILDEIESVDVSRERVEVAFITHERLSDEIRIIQEPVPIWQAVIPLLTTTTDDTSLMESLYVAMDFVETWKERYKSLGIPYYRPWIFLISNGMSLLPCNVDEIANKIKQDTSNKKYAFLAIYTKDADVSLLQEIKSDVPIMALDSLSITDCFKWLSSEMNEICSPDLDNTIVDASDWMEAFTIGDSCRGEMIHESSGSVGCDPDCYDIDDNGNVNDWDIDFGSSSIDFGGSSVRLEKYPFNYLEDLINDSDKNPLTTFESKPCQFRKNEAVDFHGYNVTGEMGILEELSVDKIAQYYDISVEEASEWLHKVSHKQTIENEVFASIFAPAEIKSKSHMLVQVYLHLFEETEKVKSLAQESQKDAERRDYIPLQYKLKKGDKVDVQLNIYGETLLMSDKKSVVWQGHFTKCSFDYFVPKDIDVDELSCVALLTVNDIPVGEMRFITRIVESPRKLNPEIIAHKYNKVFISYSHQDESKVKFLHEGLELGSVPHFFDRKYLKAGDVFPQVIQDYINSADLFILCWSENASKSEYVQKERLQALERAFPQVQPENAAKLRIYPMNIEPRAELPSDMKNYYHFGEI